MCWQWSNNILKAERGNEFIIAIILRFDDLFFLRLNRWKRNIHFNYLESGLKSLCRNFIFGLLLLRQRERTAHPWMTTGKLRVRRETWQKLQKGCEAQWVTRVGAVEQFCLDSRRHLASQELSSHFGKVVSGSQGERSQQKQKKNKQKELIRREV